MPNPQSLLLFHGTHAEYSEFAAITDRRPDHSENGALGIWLTTDLQLARRFGALRTLHVQTSFENVKIIPIAALYKINTDYNKNLSGQGANDFYPHLRAKFLAAGYDALAIQEINGEVIQYIALKPDGLKIVNVEKTEPVPARKKSIRPKA